MFLDKFPVYTRKEDALIAIQEVFDVLEEIREEGWTVERQGYIGYRLQRIENTFKIYIP